MDSNARRKKRGNWPIRRYRLGEEPDLPACSTNTAEQRLAMMWPLAKQSWLLAGKELPTYSRSQMPGIVHRPANPAQQARRQLRSRVLTTRWRS
ncbi:MAG: hypothetical protein IPJ88_04925 [Myxococcales bacterium]|nr:MAG: hypothetical protein IPJ88_04925 [Myxococcales bacterium]